MRDPIHIRDFDFVELYVGSAQMYAYWFVNAMGFKVMAYKGPETGSRDVVSYYLQQGKIKLVVTGSFTPNTYEVNAFIAQHGSGVRKFAFEVDDVESAFKYSTKERAVPVQYPTKMEDEHGFVTMASVGVFDDTELCFVNYDQYKGLFMPGFQKPLREMNAECHSPKLKIIDHIVGNVRENEMNRWADYFIKALDFKELLYFGPGDISTQFTALLSKVVCSKDGRIKMPINEPFEGKKKSQIDEYLEQYRGTGVQHIALETDDIVASIDALRKNGVEFIDIPDSYYELLQERINKLPKDRMIDEDLAELKKLKILCDFEKEGYLLQLFTKPIGDRPTLFFEIIQRKKKAKEFGHGNFQALFESIERDQKDRGDFSDRRNRSEL